MRMKPIDTRFVPQAAIRYRIWRQTPRQHVRVALAALVVVFIFPMMF